MSLIRQCTWLAVAIVAVLADPEVQSDQNELGKSATQYDCRFETVRSGDYCGNIAQRCGIPDSNLGSYNYGLDCRNLQVGQRLCCSPGSLPDIRPKINRDGTCYDYIVKSGEGCDVLEGKFGLRAGDVERFNNGLTWGWTGCAGIQAGANICVSAGLPPFPTTNPYAVCGPTKPGTAPYRLVSDFSQLNPCPLNACCDSSGQCGITSDSCTVNRGPNGNPGTSVFGRTSCISNCGNDIIKSPYNPAATPIRVGYFQSGATTRSCARMNASSINTAYYTHVHWSFAGIGDDSRLHVDDTNVQFSEFKRLKARRIITLGGGHEEGSFRFNQSLSTNGIALAVYVAEFVNTHGLDGVDVDWEFPATQRDGENYVIFLRTLKSLLGPSKTLSLAVPVSYYAGRLFPLAAINPYVDYMVVMAYDMTGQWNWRKDANVPGCPGGACLRSHVNLTETQNGLAMLTKAGIPGNKLVVGVASYGRSFVMEDPRCWGPMCRFVGEKDSPATPGPCHGQAGTLSNAEIYQIYNSGTRNAVIRDDMSGNANIMTYDTNQWVSFMSPQTKREREQLYTVGWRFAGIADWAIDLN